MKHMLWVIVDADDSCIVLVTYNKQVAREYRIVLMFFIFFVTHFISVNVPLSSRNRQDLLPSADLVPFFR